MGIVEVANTDNRGEMCRFVVVWDNKSKDHKTCDFFHHMMSKKAGVEAVRQKSLQDGKQTWMELLQVEEGELPAFVPWEEREAKICDHDLVKELFVNKRQKPKKMMKPSKAVKQDLSCKEKVDERILRVLMSSCKSKKKTDLRESKVSDGMAP